MTGWLYVSWLYCRAIESNEGYHTAEFIQLTTSILNVCDNTVYIAEHPTLCITKSFTDQCLLVLGCSTVGTEVLPQLTSITVTDLAPIASAEGREHVQNTRNHL